MKDTELTIEDRVSALEAALTASEQWNTCACGHHGSVHSAYTNACMVCECPHFATKATPNQRPVGAPSREVADAMRRIITRFRAIYPNAGTQYDDGLADIDRVATYLISLQEGTR